MHQQVEDSVVDSAAVMRVHVVGEVVRVSDGSVVPLGVLEEAQRGVLLGHIQPHHPVSFVQGRLRRLSGHVREGLVDAAPLLEVVQVGVLLRHPVAHLVAYDVQAGKRVESLRAVPVLTLVAVSEGVGVVDAEVKRL